MKTTEIERKFLVDLDKFNKYLYQHRESAISVRCFKQFYITIDEDKEVRVRLEGDFYNIQNGYIIIKYFNNDHLLTRREFTATLDKQTCVDYNEYIKQNNIPYIEKTRYKIIHDGYVFEIDMFGGDNEGLMIAEVEIPTEDTKINLPNFITTEVTGDTKYYNKNLYINPYKNWRI